MLSLLRAATVEEVEKIKPTADLTSTSSVLAWPNGEREADLAVIRQCTEIDPMYFSPDSGNSRKAFFGLLLFNILKSQGVQEIYFDVDAEGQEDWINILEKLGAQRTTSKPQFRFKLGLK